MRSSVGGEARFIRRPQLLRWMGMRVLGALLLAGLGLIGWGCGGQRPPEVVKIGLVAPFEGPARPLGYSLLYAVRLRIGEWNRAGALPRVELVALNDDGDPAFAAHLPARLAADPDVRVVLGPAQTVTALAALPGLAEYRLPTLALAPLPAEALPSYVIPFAGTTAELAAALAPFADAAEVAWSLPVTRPVIWVGDAMGLAELLAAASVQAAAAGPVALEGAAWAGADDAELVWAGAAPAALPSGFATSYQELAGEPPSPAAALAYAAADAALRALAAPSARDPDALAGLLAQVERPPFSLFLRNATTCCQLLTPP